VGSLVVETRSTGRKDLRESWKRELRNDPAVRLPVVADERVAVVLDFAGPAEPGPERVAGERPQHDIAALVVDRGDVVDVLEVVVRADVAFRIGRHDLMADDRGVVVLGSTLEPAAVPPAAKSPNRVWTAGSDVGRDRPEPFFG
jgi:hypothetical protein